MKQLLTLILTFSVLSIFADTPGKAKMHPSKISFQNLDSLPNYQFFYRFKRDNEDSVHELKNVGIIIPSSGGSPNGVYFWGVNRATKKHTNMIEVDNYYAPDYVFIINKIESDSIYYTQKELSNENKIQNDENTEDIVDKELIAGAKKAEQSHYIKIGVFTALGLLALGGIVWFWKRGKK